MVLVSRDGTYREYVESRWENDREDKRCTITSLAKHECEDNKHDAQECGDYCRELRAFAKGGSDEEGPTCEDEPKKDVDDEDEADVRL